MRLEKQMEVLASRCVESARATAAPTARGRVEVRLRRPTQGDTDQWRDDCHVGPQERARTVTSVGVRAVMAGQDGVPRDGQVRLECFRIVGGVDLGGVERK